jgi:competence protein ComEA
MKTIRNLFASLCLAALSCAAFASPVNINTADATALAQTIDGVGPKLAVAIVDYRDSNGPFQSVDELERVKGIGAKTVEKNRNKITVEVEQAQAQPQ